MIGDKLEAAFWEWEEEQGKDNLLGVPYLFCRWLVETREGQEALEAINDVPRQLWLTFEGRLMPWETDTSTQMVECVGEDGEVTGYVLAR